MGDSLTHSVSKNLEEHGEKLDDATKEEVEKALTEAKELPEDASPETIKEKVSALSAVSMKIGQAMYKGGEAGALLKKEESLRPRRPSMRRSKRERRQKLSSKAISCCLHGSTLPSCGVACHALWLDLLFKFLNSNTQNLLKK